MRRKLYILMGPPGSGKSTWIKENGFSNYAVSSDALRMLYGAPLQNVDGELTISNTRDRKVWQTFYDIIEDRLSKGEKTFIDSTNTTPKYWNRYKQYAKKYNLELVCIDFTGPTLEELLNRNEKREPLKKVPTDVIERMYTNVNNLKIGNKITKIKPDEFLKMNKTNPADMNRFKNIYHIGDIHGSIEPLKKLLKNGLEEDSLYVFVGDYVVRGINNAEVVEMLMEISKRRNTVFLRGNHEAHLEKWSRGEKSNSRVFERYTKSELEDKGVSKREVRGFIKKMRDHFFYEYEIKEKSNLKETESKNIKVLVTHGGVAKLPESLDDLSSEQMIRGVGDYSIDIDFVFSKLNNSNTYQIHGHRNIHGVPIFAEINSFNLEGSVEQGGHLRVVKLNKFGFQDIEIKNDVYHSKYDRGVKKYISENIFNKTKRSEFIEELESDNFIRKKKEGNITAFNFNKTVFRKALWNERRNKARGLFIDTKTTEIAARGYDKFFNIDERRETELENLKDTLEFPIDVYHKDNGFLGIVGLNRYKGELLIASKSTTGGKHARLFKKMFEQEISYNKEAKLYEELDDRNLTLVFEVIDPDNDPHIIDYSINKIVLLDAIYRQEEFKKISYCDLLDFGKRYGLEVKEKTNTFYDYEEFKKWYNDIKDDFNIKSEGFVIEDAKGFHVKIKLPYYSFWKWSRGQIGSIIKVGVVKQNYLESDLGASVGPKMIELYKEQPHLFESEDIPKIRKLIGY